MSATDRDESVDTPRQPPRVVRLELPRHRPTSRVATWSTAVLLGAVTILMPIAVPEALYASILAALVAGRLVWDLTRTTSAYCRECQTLLATLTTLEDRAVAEALAPLMAHRYRWAGRDRIVQALAEAAKSRTDRALVVCLAPIVLPPTGEYRFEPEVISPTRRAGRHLLVIPWALAAWVLLCAAAWLPSRAATGCVFMVLGAVAIGLTAPALITSASWLFGLLFAPDYVRIAPGVIQILKYRHWRRTPVLQSFPVEAGTLVVADKNSVTFARGRQRAVLHVWAIPNAAALKERIWAAVMSTAPTPPLSAEDLVG